MKTNVFVELSGLAGEEKEKFSKWLDQRNAVSAIDRVFEEHPELLDDGANEKIKEVQPSKTANTTATAPAQVRYVAAVGRPFAVLSQWVEDSWLIAPFAPYTLPATPGELSTGIEFHAYAVIEAWNSIVVTDEWLQEHTTSLRTIDEQVRKDACALFFAQLEGSEAAFELSDRIGPAIHSEFDPRIQYMQEEKRMLESIR